MKQVTVVCVQAGATHTHTRAIHTWPLCTIFLANLHVCTGVGVVACMRSTNLDVRGVPKLGGGGRAKCEQWLSRMVLIGRSKCL